MLNEINIGDVLKIRNVKNNNFRHFIVTSLDKSIHDICIGIFSSDENTLDFYKKNIDRLNLEFDLSPCVNVVYNRNCPNPEGLPDYIYEVVEKVDQLTIDEFTKLLNDRNHYKLLMDYYTIKKWDSPKLGYIYNMMDNINNIFITCDIKINNDIILTHNIYDHNIEMPFKLCDQIVYGYGFNNRYNTDLLIPIYCPLSYFNMHHIFHNKDSAIKPLECLYKLSDDIVENLQILFENNIVFNLSDKNILPSECNDILKELLKSYRYKY